MMSELRWRLLILGVAFIAALAWWERHRPRQASRGGAAQRTGTREPAAREPTLSLPQMRARDPLVPRDLPVVEFAREHPVVPVLEPARLDAGRHSPGDAPDVAADGGAAGSAAARAAEAAAMDVVHGVPAGGPFESLPSLP